MDRNDITGDDHAGAATGKSPSSPIARARHTLTRPRRDSWDSRKLLDGRAEVSIKHNGEIYTLHHTQAGKLLLTK
ncbi:hypothetical protein BH09PSE6_BH09PSE6_16280 [soil metagenome]